MRTAAFAVFVLTAVWCGWFVLIWASALARGVGGGLVNVLLIPAAVVALVVGGYSSASAPWIASSRSV
jgi:hypothetical protein